ncbi:MAG: LacI family DNA-binding transcriptional regulator [Lentisphaeria bacterium]|nr:LacI family DNA-binding transcriptional regulator [Lentisphaeria bacterium]
MPEKKKVTISMLAEELNLSRTAVTLALNGRGHLNPHTVERVRELARKLNYTPDPVARALRTRISNTVGVILLGPIVNPWNSQLVRRFESELARHGLNMLLALPHGDHRKAHEAIVNFSGSRVDGIIMGIVLREQHLAEMLGGFELPVPLVVFNSHEPLQVSSVSVNQVAGGRIAVEYLIRQGHRRIGYLACPDKDMIQPAGSRLSGFRATLEEAGLPSDLVFPRPDPFSRRTGYDAMMELLQSSAKRDLPTAFFCHSDDIALGAMLAIRQMGYRIPDDFSLVGFDDVEESSLEIPALTTVGGALEPLTRGAVDVLRDAISGRHAEPRTLAIQPKLIVRESCKTPDPQIS